MDGPCQEGAQHRSPQILTQELVVHQSLRNQRADLVLNVKAMAGGRCRHHLLRLPWIWRLYLANSTAASPLASFEIQWLDKLNMTMIVIVTV